MTIEATLYPDRFVRLSIWRHLSRVQFFFWAITATLITVYVFSFGGDALFLLAGWLPFLTYIVLGIFEATRNSRNPDNPVLWPTKYQLDSKGIAISNKQGESYLDWEQFIAWQYIAQCYVLLLPGRVMIVIPKSSLSPARVTKLESMLNEYIKKD